MTTTTDTTTTAPAEEEIFLFARVGSDRIALTARQVRDTVAAYLATGGHMPTPTDVNGGDPYAPLHVITEEWLWGNGSGWADRADVVQLATYRHQAITWIRTYFGPTFPELNH
ncbi:MAG: hypothetical protein ACRDRR_02155 [Pseudonocardiaceae bacterium]